VTLSSTLTVDINPLFEYVTKAFPSADVSLRFRARAAELFEGVSCVRAACEDHPNLVFLPHFCDYKYYIIMSILDANSPFPLCKGGKKVFHESFFV
jgi:hypothetical protein